MGSGATLGLRDYVGVVVSVLAGGAILFGVLKGLGGSTTAAPGDEPPITVKHGSIKLDLLASKGHQRWDKNGAAWGIGDNSGNGQSFEHNSDKYDVVIGVMNVPGAQNPCAAGTFAQASKVTFTYSDNNWVTLEIVGKKTSVTAAPGFLKNSTDKELEFESGSNFVDSVSLDGSATPFCKFEKGQFGAVALQDSN